MAYQLGIDLGTTYTAAAVHRDGRVDVMALGDRGTVIPSVVFVKDDGGVLTGEAANRRGRAEPERVAREFKRRMGDPAPIIVGGIPFASDVLLARLLRSVVDQVAEREGAYPDGIAITHPANWGDYKLDLLRQAVRHAGFGDYPVTHLAEPEAAAMHYAIQERVPPGSVVAVYDLGGGTFDAAVLRRQSNGRFEIVGRPEGIERLGGIDFDAAVLSHIDQVLDGAVSKLDEGDDEAVQAVGRLRTECIEAKEQLSSDVDVSVPVSLPGVRHTVRLTRSEFEGMIRPAINETITALRRSLQSAAVANDGVQAVLLVGGSSRIPLVSQIVSAALGRPAAVDAHPKHAIAQGAAVAAAQRAGAGTSDTVTVVERAETQAPAVTGPVPLAPSVPGGAPPPTPPTPPPFGPAPPAARRKPPLAPIAIGAAAVLILAAIAFIVFRGGDEDEPTDTTEQASGLGAVTDEGDLWIGSTRFGGLVKIDREERSIVENLPIQNLLDAPTVGNEFVWAVAGDLQDGPTVYQIDRAEATVVNRIQLPLDPADRSGGIVGLLRAEDGVWARVTADGGPTLGIHITDEGEIDATGEMDIVAFSFATDGESLFALDGSGVLARVAPDGEVQQSDVPVAQGEVVSVGGDLYVVSAEQLHTVDPGGLRVTDSVPYEHDGEAFTIPDFDFGASFLFSDDETVSLIAEGQATTFVQIAVDGAEVSAVDLPIAGNLLNAVRLAPGSDGTFWAYGNNEDRVLGHIDVENEEVEVIDVAQGPGDTSTQLVASPELVAVADSDVSPVLYLVDAGEDSVEETTTSFLWPFLPRLAGGDVWLTEFAANEVTVVDGEELDVGEPLELDGVGLAGEAGDRVLVPTGGAELLVVDPAEPDNPGAITLPAAGFNVLVDGNAVFVSGSDRFMRIDLANDRVVQTIPGSDYLTPLDYPLVAGAEAIGEGALWDLFEGGVTRIDIATGATRPTTISGTPVEVSVEGGFAWVSTGDGQVVRLDPATGAAVGSIDVGEEPGFVEQVGETFWFIEIDGGNMHRLELAGIDDVSADGVADTIEIGSGSLTTALAVGSDLWIANEGSGTLTRYDELGEAEVEVELGGRPMGVVGDENAAFVVLQDEATLVRVDPDGGTEEIDLD